MKIERSKIRLDGGTQPRGGIDEAAAREYGEGYQRGDNIPPVELIFDGQDYWLWDGFHRMRGAELIDLQFIEANVQQGTLALAQWLSFGANKRQYALRRTNEDKRRAVTGALRHSPQKSNSEIAVHVGVDDKTVARYRAELEASSEIPKITEREVTRGGQTFTQQTSSIGSRSGTPPFSQPPASSPTPSHPFVDLDQRWWKLPNGPAFYVVSYGTDGVKLRSLDERQTLGYNISTAVREFVPFTGQREFKSGDQVKTRSGHTGEIVGFYGSYATVRTVNGTKSRKLTDLAHVETPPAAPPAEQSEPAPTPAAQPEPSAITDDYQNSPGAKADAESTEMWRRGGIADAVIDELVNQQSASGAPANTPYDIFKRGTYVKDARTGEVLYVKAVRAAFTDLVSSPESSSGLVIPLSDFVHYERAEKPAAPAPGSGEALKLELREAGLTTAFKVVKHNGSSEYTAAFDSGPQFSVEEAGERATEYAHQMIALGYSVIKSGCDIDSNIAFNGYPVPMVRFRIGGTPILTSKSTEWYTPEPYVEAARLVLGAIDLDPASCEAANRTVQAARYFTVKDNGLVQTWQGRVWLNPPYGKDDNGSRVAQWVDKLLAEFDSGRVPAALLLVNATTERAWFQPLWEHLICFTDHRIEFEPGAGQEARQPVYGNAFILLTEDEAMRQRFKEVFSQFGHIVTETYRKAVEA